ncbi:hypothetical protein [Parachitinimonas caeni]|uniref:Uncharacterized protein n=1 Tax=Parachitinimonas caeni TaxID=3031301 RepID=A0ABT7E6V0_9NEIS|nr:hypothetical protein [Parachitinimonas caeni]MDK2126642.1 hypothetical protein [Parachitinimonas caeni]
MQDAARQALEALFDKRPQQKPAQQSITEFCNELAAQMKQMGLDYIVIERRHYDALLLDRNVDHLTKWRGMRIQIVNEGFVSAA